MISDYILANRKELVAPRITCDNGLTMSVQASHLHYCSPRNNAGPYDRVEVGYPSDAIDELLQYAENPEDPTETIYGYVPVEVVESVIARNGGIKQGA